MVKKSNDQRGAVGPSAANSPLPQRSNAGSDGRHAPPVFLWTQRPGVPPFHNTGCEGDLSTWSRILSTALGGSRCIQASKIVLKTNLDSSKEPMTYSLYTEWCWKFFSHTLPVPNMLAWMLRVCPFNWFNSNCDDRPLIHVQIADRDWRSEVDKWVWYPRTSRLQFHCLCNRCWAHFLQLCSTVMLSLQCLMVHGITSSWSRDAKLGCTWCFRERDDDALPIRNALEDLAGWGRCWQQGAAIKVESWEHCGHQHGTKPFICLCPCAISHAHPSPAEMCLLYKPSVAGRWGGVQKKENKCSVFHLSPNAHCSPFRRMMELCAPVLGVFSTSE